MGRSAKALVRGAIGKVARLVAGEDAEMGAVTHARGRADVKGGADAVRKAAWQAVAVNGIGAEPNAMQVPIH